MHDPVLDPPRDPVLNPLHQESADRPTPGAAANGRNGVSSAVQPLRLVLVNDYEIILQGLHAMLEPFRDRVRIVDHQVGGVPDTNADVALFDTFAGRRDALSRAATMLSDGHVRHVVMYTFDAAGEFLDEARAIGVSGVVLKSVTGSDLVEAIEHIVAGEHVGLEHVARGARSAGEGGLSAREQEVLAMLALGRTNVEIAQQLFLSVDTVKTYVRRVFAKLGVKNRTQAALHPLAASLRPRSASTTVDNGEQMGPEPSVSTG